MDFIEEAEPAYWFCTSCEEGVEDAAAVCCDDGEIEPAYDECPEPG